MNYTDPSGHREIGADENDLLPHEPTPLPPPSFIPAVRPFNTLPVNPSNITQGINMQGFGDTTFAFEHRAGTEEPLYALSGFLHSGWDIPMNSGTDLFALGEGIVICVGSTCGQSGGPSTGIAIRYDSCNCVVFYLHLSSILAGLIEGSPVTLGMTIGQSGESNGYEHLHVEIRPVRGELTFYNPLYFFTKEILSVVPNEFMPYEDHSNPWRIYRYSAAGRGSYWEKTLFALWVR